MTVEPSHNASPRWYYLGLVDDRVRRWRLPEFQLDVDPLQTLLYAALLGRRVLIHQSAFCIQEPFLRDAARGSHSFVATLAAAGRLRLLTGEGSLAAWIADKRGGVYRSDDAEAVSALRFYDANMPAIGKFSDRIADLDAYVGFPRVDHSWALERLILGDDSVQGLEGLDGRSSFVLARRDQAIDEKSWSSLLKRFEQNMRTREAANRQRGRKFYSAARTEYENAVRALFGDTIQARLAMAVANERYHNAMSGLLSAELGRPIGSLTCMTGAFRPYAVGRRSVDPSRTEAGAEDALIFVNAKKIIRDLHLHADQLFGTQTPLGKARQAVVELLEKSYREAADQVALATRCIEYETRLALCFGYSPPRAATGAITASNAKTAMASGFCWFALTAASFAAISRLEHEIEHRIGHRRTSGPAGIDETVDGGVGHSFRIGRRDFLKFALAFGLGTVAHESTHALRGSIITQINAISHDLGRPRLASRAEFCSLPLDSEFCQRLAVGGPHRIGGYPLLPTQLPGL